ncbi:hypothetical protein CBM2599_A150055 [Cupriavidus taiwanensis]|nr:hypothetical protein CBM2599_A150055 [Cupriavidus taiwanensis]
MRAFVTCGPWCAPVRDDNVAPPGRGAWLAPVSIYAAAGRLDARLDAALPIIRQSLLARSRPGAALPAAVLCHARQPRPAGRTAAGRGRG